MDLTKLGIIANRIYMQYANVASGETRGDGGSFYADGKGTLNAVQIDINVLEELAEVLQRPTFDRTYTARQLAQR